MRRQGMFLISSLLLTSCYSIEQSIGQIKLWQKSQSLSKVVEEKLETQERLDKLKLVEPSRKWAQEYLNLNPGESYLEYISLDRPYVTYIVQAAYPQKLERKTWWFPFIGNQPYLGYFDKEKALKLAEELKKEDYDVKFGGVRAFSLLGYFADPLYSSMIDGMSYFQFVETLFHEMTHATIFIKNANEFNENIAQFIGFHAAQKFAESFPEYHISIPEIKNLDELRKKYREFLKETLRMMGEFYKENQDLWKKDRQAFLEKRRLKFEVISQDYHQKFSEEYKDTYFQWYFPKKEMNNAILLGYSLYEANQKPFEKFFEKCRYDISLFIKEVKKCTQKANAKTVYQLIEECEVEDAL